MVIRKDILYFIYVAKFDHVIRFYGQCYKNRVCYVCRSPLKRITSKVKNTMTEPLNDNKEIT